MSSRTILQGLGVCCLAAALVTTACTADRDSLEGTYNVSLSQEDVPELPDVAGDWDITFQPDGNYRVNKDGSLMAEGTYSVTGDTIFLSDMSGPEACNDAPHASYTYRFERGRMVATRLHDACEERVAVLTEPLRW